MSFSIYYYFIKNTKTVFKIDFKNQHNFHLLLKIVKSFLYN